MRKLHLGNGTIYLKGYANIDIDQEHHYLATERPDLIEINGTTFENYYKEDVNRNTIEDKSRQFKEVVYDMFADIRNLPFRDNSVDEILLAQVFEHFTYNEGDNLLKSWLKLLKIGGKLLIDVPDLDKTITLYEKAKTKEDKEWATRLLFGSQKNDYGVHKDMYSFDTLKEKLEKIGYKDIKQVDYISHFYPAFMVEAIKA